MFLKKNLTFPRACARARRKGENKYFQNLLLLEGVFYNDYIGIKDSSTLPSKGSNMMVIAW